MDRQETHSIKLRHYLHGLPGCGLHAGCVKETKLNQAEKQIQRSIHWKP